MAYTARRQTSEPAPPKLPKLSPTELARIAGQQITELLDEERRIAVERKALWFPRSRRFGRALLLGWLSIVETFAGAWRAVWTPRHTPGRLVRRVKLLAPTKTFSPWMLLLVLAAGALLALRFTTFKDHEPEQTLTGAVGGAILIALLVSLWSNLVRLPFLAWRVRRRIIPRPERVLQANLVARQARSLVQQLALDIVPRNELYDDLLPGVLARDRRDVQIVMGDAGAGKTTALLAVAKLLAQNGIVPVLVPLRSHTETKLIDPAKDRFKNQVEAQVRSNDEAELLWRWLVLRRRVAILIDDIDQIGPDGERGLVLRTMLDEAAESGLSAIATARPAGVPAGVAASAIDLGALEERDAVEHVIKRAKAEPSAGCATQPSRRRIEEWVKEGELAEVPFYLELLAALAAVGQCPRLPHAGSMGSDSKDAGRVYRKPNGDWKWNKLWVRFQLLEHYYEQTVFGRVRRSLGMEPRERRSTLEALEYAALGTLVASSLEARMTLAPRDVSEAADKQRPLRKQIREFIDTDDRSGLHVEQDGKQKEASTRRANISAHEVIDAGERLAILELRAQQDGTMAFHHRIMQAYLAARCLAVREYRAGDERRINPVDRKPENERDWIAALLDHRHPDKLTAHMTLIFAAMRAREIAEARSPHEVAKNWNKVGKRIVETLIKGAHDTREGKPLEEDEQAPARMLVTLMTESESEQTQLTLALVPEQEHDANPSDERERRAALLDPLYKPDYEHRADPDDALMKLTTAAQIAVAVPEAAKDVGRGGGPESISKEIWLTPGPTRWTKLNAIEALSVPSSSISPPSSHFEPEAEDELPALGSGKRWQRIWDFARDPDYVVKRAASTALEENAYESFKALANDIESLIARAAARSAYGRWLVRPDNGNGNTRHEALDMPSLLSLMTDAMGDGHSSDVATWSTEDIDSLAALGSILPAIMSGFREDPSIELESTWADEAADDAHEHAPSPGITSAQDREDEDISMIMCHRPWIRKERLDYARRARYALESLVALAFEGSHGDLESAVAQGFRSDALRHAESPERNFSGPGWVTSNRHLVAGICLDHATFWYARIALYQALALYAVAGASAQETFDIFARHTGRGGRDRHPFTRRAARLARAAVRRSELRSGRWLAYVWGDEGKDTGRRAAQLTNGAAQLLADVTVLLNLNEHSPEDRQEGFVQMQSLPYCLSGSRDRSEILGEGCPSQCGWGLCPYQQSPPDEPDTHRGVRRAFCRQQREIALRRKPPWQRGIHRKTLREFWREMELRART